MENAMITPSHLVVALAINGSRKTKYVVRWALDKFVPEGILVFKLFFIRPKITKIPTPMGSLPISQVREDVAIAYKKEVEWQIYEQLLPFKNMCTTRKVEVEIVLIESDDVAEAIKYEIEKQNIGKLVIGASSKGMFSRGQNLSARICESTPSFCTVYVILKGTLSLVRASYSKTVECSKDDTNSNFSSSFTNSCSVASSSLAPSSRTEMGQLDAILCNNFIKNEFVSHAFDIDDKFYLERAKKPVSESHPQPPATQAQTRNETSRSSSPTKPFINEGISIKRAREDFQDASESQVLVRHRGRRSPTKKSSPKSDVAVIDQLARHLHGESYPRSIGTEVDSDLETSICNKPDYSDDDYMTPESYAHESDIHVTSPFDTSTDWGSDIGTYVSEEEEDHETESYPSTIGKQLDVVNQTTTSLTPSSTGVEKDSMDTYSNQIYHRRMSEEELFDVIMASQARMKFAMHELYHRSVQTEHDKKRLYSKIKQLDKVGLKVMSLKAKNKCWDMKNVILSLEETNLGQVASMAQVKMAESACCQEVEEKLVKMKEALESTQKLVEAQSQQYRLQLNQLQSHQDKQMAIMKENMAQQLLNNVPDHVSKIEELKRAVDILTEEKNWLITQGFSHFSKKILSCLDLQTKARDHLVEATKEFEQISFSCVGEIAGMVGEPFEDIKSFIQNPYDRLAS